MGKIEVFNRKEILTNAGAFGNVWRIESGCFRLDCSSFTGTGLVQLAFAGDLIGIEMLCGRPYTHTATALTKAIVSEVSTENEFDRFKLVTQGYVQQQFRTRDMVKIRSGLISERIEYFLKLLSTTQEIELSDHRKPALPSNKELAEILGTTPETICRELKAFIPSREYVRPSNPHGKNLDHMVMA